MSQVQIPSEERVKALESQVLQVSEAVKELRNVLTARAQLLSPPERVTLKNACVPTWNRNSESLLALKNKVNALRDNLPRPRSFTNQELPEGLRAQFATFAAFDGTPLHSAFVARKTLYLTFVVRHA